MLYEEKPVAITRSLTDHEQDVVEVVQQRIDQCLQVAEWETALAWSTVLTRLSSSPEALIKH